MRSMIRRFMILLALGLLAGCGAPMFSRFAITQQAYEAPAFLEPGARIVAFPLLSRDYSKVDSLYFLSGRFEDALRENRDHLSVIPFDDLLDRVVDTGAEETLLRLLNDYRRTGTVRSRAAMRLAEIGAADEPGYFIFLKLTAAERYRDLARRHKAVLRAEGSVFSIRYQKTLFTFACAVHAEDARASQLPDGVKLSDALVAEISKGLPWSPRKALELEKRSDW